MLALSIPVIVPAILSVASLFTAASAQTQLQCANTYTVQPDDNCNSIAAAQNVSNYQIAQANFDKPNICNLDRQANLQSGETICLEIVEENCSDLYTVVSGDSCWDIANNNIIPTGTGSPDMGTFYTNNGLSDAACSLIQPGNILCIDDDIVPYTACD